MTLTPELQDRCRRILDFWHKVEFFIPFDLQGQVLEAQDADWSVRLLSMAHLDSMAPHECGGLWQIARVPEGKQLSGFELYLGRFDKSQLGEIAQQAARQILPSPLSPNEAVEQDERTDLEGATCFAKIRLNAKGEPLLDEISVSSVPWALGRVLAGGLASLDFDAFQRSLKQLQEDLYNFRSARSAATQGASGGTSPLEPKNERPLTSSDLKSLLEVFHAWAGFTPEDKGQGVIVVRALASKAPKSKPANESGAPMPTTSSVEELNPAAPEASVAEDDDEDGGNESEIEILNSFYAKDIQRIIQALDRGEINAALLAYLTPLADRDRLDLYTHAGRERIEADLHPRLTPPAHWFAEPHHAMSLMQQFAINNAFQVLESPGLFSVNGPPGTGKTTLLRDIFAENITRRARILARYERASDALCLDAKLKVEFEGVSKPYYVAPLKPELTGFEMIVASSNNAAVENISRDLPKTKALGTLHKDPETGKLKETAWRHADGAPRHTYLQPVACRIAAQNHKGEFGTLDVDDTPWGLISAALGNRANRRAFADRIRFPPQKPGEPPPKGYDPEKHQNIWQWRERYDGLSFADAKQKFIAADDAVAQRRMELEEFIRIQAELGGHDENSYCRSEMQAVIDAEHALQAAQRECAQLDQALRETLSRLEDLREIERLLHQDCPSWWKRWIKHADARVHQAKLAENRQAQRLAIHEKLDLHPRLERVKHDAQAAEALLENAQRTLSDRRKRWDSLHATLSGMGVRFPKAAHPACPDDLEERNWQRNGIWHDDNLNKLRSDLFAAALDLQQAWLADVMQKRAGCNPFSQNMLAICDMLGGKRLSDASHALPIWQSLFMLVPVVSSTFASIASQFRELGANALGWLFIDEAGQAVPQAAAGALWRCRHAVVVGDPLQIEPVFTVPIKLIEALALTSKLPGDAHVMPHKASAQNLADAANALGTWINAAGNGRQWIGSPLRVHRRCVYPMFGIANAIAYDGKMIYGPDNEAPPVDSLDLGESSWVQIAGQVSHKQVVPAQVDLVFQALVSLTQSLGELPPLYIISPFKQIKMALAERIADPDNWRRIVGGSAKLPSKTALSDWRRDRVGTVHTFQGKEQSIVWMVLGCDKEKTGGANWASDKPNLLNVALTRAQHRVFLIGDADLWGGKNFFHTAKRILPRISPQEFQDRMLLQTSRKYCVFAQNSKMPFPSNHSDGNSFMNSQQTRPTVASPLPPSQP